MSGRGDKVRRESVDQLDERGDAPDPASAPAAAVLALQRGAGNQATAALIARMRRPSAEVSVRTLQRRWLFAERPYFFFWDDDGTQMDEEELGAPEFRSIQWRSTLVGDAPPIPPYVVELKSHKELVERPGAGGARRLQGGQRHQREEKPSDHWKPHDGFGRRPRDGDPDTSALNTYLGRDVYKERYGIKAPSKRSETFNPFGRFASAVYSVYLDPRMPAEMRAPIVASLDRDPQFRRPAEPPIVMPTVGGPMPAQPAFFAYPNGFLSVKGEQMVLVEVNDFGAMYRVKGDTEKHATPDAAPTKPPGDPAKLRLTTGAAELKFVMSGSIDSKLLASWAGTRAQAVSQAGVMGASAAVAAANAGFPINDPRDWEWLHLIAYSLGGIGGNQPQQAPNLVAGTAECNTEMIVAEEMIKSAVMRAAKDHHALVVDLEAAVRMYDPVRHIGREIGYTFKLSDDKGGALAVFNFRFNALGTVKPIVGKNRMVRAYGDAHFATGFTDAKRYTTGKPGELTEMRNRPYIELDEKGLEEDKLRVLADFADDPAEQRSDASIETITTYFHTGGPEASADVIGQRWKAGERPPSEVFDFAGEQFSPEQLVPFFRRLRQLDGVRAEGAIRRTLHSALLDDRLGDKLEPVLFLTYETNDWSGLAGDLQMLRTWKRAPDHERDLGEGAQEMPIDNAMVTDEEEMKLDV